MQSARKGLFVALEGIDGSGKTSLTQNLSKLLSDHGLTILTTREPGATGAGKELRKLLQSPEHALTPLTEAFLFAADRTEHIKQIVRPALDNDNIVISDRTYLSSLVYQGFAGSVSLDFLTDINHKAMGSTHIDLVIYVRITPEQAAERIIQRGAEKTRFELKQSGFLAAIFEGYDKLLLSRNNVLVLDGMKSPDQLAREAFEGITAHYEQKASSSRTPTHIAFE
jgi:dTMP kinase